MNLMRVAAVDDEIHVLERFERMLQSNTDIELCGMFETGTQFLSYLKDHPVDVVFLDIEMSDMNGLELAAHILNLNEEIQIVFVTAFNQYALEAFEVHAVDYILKPLSEERLSKILARLFKNKKNPPQQTKPFIQCFGDFEVFVDGKALAWKNSKAKEILAFLVQKGGVPTNWEKISDAVWPEYNTEKAQTNFHATTYLLRKRLTEAGIAHIFENGRGNYRILTDQVSCDLYDFEALMKNGKSERENDLALIRSLCEKGYMEASGYGWAHGKAVELENICHSLIK